MEIREGDTSKIEDLRLLENVYSADPFEYGMTKFEEEHIYMSEGDKQKVYDPTRILRNVHWGQLKLFCSEMFLFLRYLKPVISDVLYIGAAPGEHLYVLTKLFPQLTYHLYDSENFDRRLDNLDNVKIYKKYFDDSDVKKWKKDGGKMLENFKSFKMVENVRKKA